MASKITMHSNELGLLASVLSTRKQQEKRITLICADSHKYEIHRQIKAFRTYYKKGNYLSNLKYYPVI